MAPPPKVSPPPNSRITAVPLTQETFSPFGTVITSPLPRDLASIPSRPKSQSQSSHSPPAVIANQSTALKYSPISPLQNGYTKHCPSGQGASARMSMFSCFPRRLRQKRGGEGGNGEERGQGREHLFDVSILERHPYTTQTFIPLDLSSKRSVQSGRNTEQLEPVYLVIVAPSLSGQNTTAKGANGEPVSVTNPPDLKNLRAFVARGGQAVTYGAGTWHAPMVVLGNRKVDFVVVQFANGVEGEDCQEVTIGDGLVVDVDVEVGGGGITGLWPGRGGVARSKL
ncbi:hypothetical protein FQN54_003309 [Arachnomyces sp. PD_36]|nr:hypothetical protein FQN54_003309 [Arachnomyces sp. PD_36]